MAKTGDGCLSLAGKCLTISLKIYHIILFIPLLVVSFYVLPKFIVRQGTTGLNLLYETSLYTWIDVFAVMFICATVIGIVGAIFRHKIMNFVFLFLAALFLLGPLTYSHLELDINPTLSVSKINELNLQMKSVEWSETKLERAFPRVNEASVQWHLLQNSLKCCGLNSTSNWVELRSPQVPVGFLPSSCCRNQKVFIEFKYCFVSDGTYVPAGAGLTYRSCIDAAKSRFHNREDNLWALLFGALQLHQAVLNVILSYFGSRKGVDKF